MRVAIHHLKLPRQAAKRRYARIATVLAAVTLSPLAIAQDMVPPSSPQPFEEDPVVPEISRDGWRLRIEEARRKSREVAIERRSNPARFEPPPQEDRDLVATERVLNDQSLQFGDIVSTRNGLFVFRGRSDRERKADDFVPLPSR